MSALGGSFNSSIFRRDYPIVIATNRASAVLLPVKLRYDSDGYVAGQVLARNTDDGMYEDYVANGSSGTDTAAAVLFESHPVEDFSGTASTDSCMAVGIFGGCTLYYDNCTDIDSGAIADLNAVKIIDATGVSLLKF